MERALEYFDSSFPPVYTTRWPSIRLGLLCKRKYVAVLNNYTSVDKTEEVLQVCLNFLF